jgi:hypothetical protein
MNAGIDVTSAEAVVIRQLSLRGGNHGSNQAAAHQVVPGLLSDRGCKTGVSSLSLKRKLGVNYRSTWLVHNNIMQAMREREEAYLGGELNGGKSGLGSENKAPIVGAISLDDAGHPIHVKVAKVATFSLAAIAD